MIKLFQLPSIEEISTVLVLCDPLEDIDHLMFYSFNIFLEKRAGGFCVSIQKSYCDFEGIVLIGTELTKDNEIVVPMQRKHLFREYIEILDNYVSINKYQEVLISHRNMLITEMLIELSQ